MSRIVAEALAGWLINLPHAFALHSYIGVLGTGVAGLLVGGGEVGTVEPVRKRRE